MAAMRGRWLEAMVIAAVILVFVLLYEQPFWASLMSGLVVVVLWSAIKVVRRVVGLPPLEASAVTSDVVPIDSNEHESRPRPGRHWRPTGRTLVVIGIGGWFALMAWTALLVAISGLGPDAEGIAYVLGMLVTPLAFLIWIGVLVVLGYLRYANRIEGEPPVRDEPEAPASDAVQKTGGHGWVAVAVVIVIVLPVYFAVLWAPAVILGALVGPDALGGAQAVYDALALVWVVLSLGITALALRWVYRWIRQVIARIDDAVLRRRAARSPEPSEAVIHQVELPASLAAGGGPDPELAAEIQRWRQQQGGSTRPAARH